MIFILFFKQRTAYEMRISDWSSDVCSSDLTTYRALVRELIRRGHKVIFLERDVPWYAAERDLPRPPYGQTYLYRDLDQLRTTYANLVERADLVIVGSYVPEGVAVDRKSTRLNSSH